MYARQRINQYYTTLSIILAAWIGLIANSWIVFGIAAAILILLHLIGGTIRFGGGSRHPRVPKPRFRAGRYA